jgi:membrane-bound lytic murein transglycosylase D
MRNIVVTLMVSALLISSTADAGFRLFERRKDQPKPVVQSIDTRAVDGLYNDLARATSDFQAGLELQRSGKPRAGRQRQDAALKLLDSASTTCAQTRGCEVTRFFSAWQTVLKLQALEGGAALAQGDEDPAVTEVRMAEADAAPAPVVRATTRAYVRMDSKLLKARIVLNEPVRAAINDWLTWMRPQLIETWTNYQFMRDLMWPRYEESGLPEALLFAILAKESVGRVHAYSRAGAAGPLQFMPDTGRRYGLKIGGGEDERLDPKAATGANVAYLIDQLTQHQNSVELALAAYNGGEGRVKRLMEKNPGKDFWSDSVYYALPGETRDYVPKVLAAAYLFLHPEEFNLKFPTLPGSVAQLTLSSPASLNELAICLGQDGRTDGWFRTLRNLNARLKTDERVPAGSEIRVPRAVLPAYAQYCSNERFMARVQSLQEARYPTGARYVAYAVRRGDTLSSIARSSNCIDVAALANLNAIAAPRYAIKPGQLIKLPTCS